MQVDKIKKQRRKIPRKVTPASLENAALYYLQRFATSAENLRQVLIRRIQRSTKHHEIDSEACIRLVNELIGRYQESGLLDDRVYARAQAVSLNRRGKSLRAIRVRLRQKAVGSDIIDDTVRALGDEIGDADRAAAIAYARKRRFGPFRTKDATPENRDKELAALARSGFSYSLSRSIIEAIDIDELE